MKDRLKVLTQRGHPNCLEAIMLDENKDRQIQRLKAYISRVPEEVKAGRRARRFLEELTGEAPG